MRNRYEKFRIFNGLNASQINLFEQKISIIKHSKNDIIFNEGEKGETLFLLLEGEVEITQALTLELSKANFDTREKSILNLKSDQYPIFGEMSIFGSKELRTATVKAISDCKMGEISKFDLLQLCEKDNKICYIVMSNICSIITDNLINANKNILKLTTAFSLILDK